MVADGGKPTDHELLRRMRLGDESALEELYVRYGGLVYTLALRIVGDRELAREVLQDTFLRSWDGREGYDPQRGQVAWWLMGIARNRAVDLLRSRSHQARLREREPLTPNTPARESTARARHPAGHSAGRCRRASVLETGLGDDAVGHDGKALPAQGAT
jgi:RNA polymerase sigma-70 factor (ECF subfamily)